jgi:ASC-1-like (ASCH) protein
MKNWTLRFRAIDKPDFEALVSGLKSIETRAATAKYRAIQARDTITLVCGGESCRKTIEKVDIYSSLAEMFLVLDFKKIMPYAKDEKEAEKVYYGYPGYKEKIAKNGIIALHLAAS